MQKNVASQKIQLFAFDTTTGAPKTGDAANITAYVSKDHGSVTVLTDTSATEMDATNAKGIYVFDLAQTETNADELTFSAKSSTSNVSITPRFISTTPQNWNLHSIDSNGRVDVIKVAGTTQTAGDIIGDTNDIQTRLPAALVSGRMDSSVGAMAANVMTAAAAAADLTTELQSGLATAAALSTVNSATVAIQAKTDNLPSDPADQSLIIAGTNAIAALIGTPAGVSLSADVAAVKSETASILTDTAEIGAAGAGLSAIPWNASWDAEVQSEVVDALNVYDPPTNAEMEARTLVAASYATASALTAVDSSLGVEIAAVKAVTDKMDTAMELDVAVYRFTTNALEQAPSGGSGGLDAAGVRAAIGLASANLDTQLASLQSDTNDIQTRIPAALVGGRIDANMGAISTSDTAADNLERGALALVLSTCAVGSTTTSIVTNLTEATDDHYNGRVITFTSGALAGQTTSISDYNGTTKTLTVVALTEAPASTDAFVIS